MVTPPPAQLDIPLWVAGENADSVGRALSLPAVAEAPAAVDRTLPVAPGRVQLVGDVDADRQQVIEWSSAGATHLLCTLGARQQSTPSPTGSSPRSQCPIPAGGRRDTSPRGWPRVER